MNVSERMDANLISSIAVLAENTDPQGLCASRDGIVVTAVGRGGPTFNTAMVTAVLDDPGTAIAWACIALEGKGDGSKIEVPREFVDERVEAALVANGRRLHEVLPGMACPMPERLPSPLPGLHIERVCDRKTLDAYAVTAAANFGSPDPEGARGLFPVSLVNDSRITLFNGFVDSEQEPVATAVVVVTDGVTGIYSITTAAAQRGRGIGAAMTWATVSVGRDAGADLCVLQATPLGLPVYTAMGFRPVREYLRYTVPSSDEHPPSGGQD